jgi:hypothetical protein
LSQHKNLSESVVIQSTVSCESTDLAGSHLRFVSPVSSNTLCLSRRPARPAPSTAPSAPQATPSQVQQSVLFCHDKVSPPYCESLARNWRRELFCSMQELAGWRNKAKSISTNSSADKGMGNPFLHLRQEWSCCCCIAS